MLEDRLIHTTSIWKDVSQRLILIVHMMVSCRLFYNGLLSGLIRKMPYRIRFVGARKLLALSLKSFENFTKLDC